MSKQVPYNIKNAWFVINQIGNVYGHPLNAFKEYPVNSVDGYQGLKIDNPDANLDSLQIGIVVSKKNRAIMIEDNGTGLSYEFLESIPQNIGESVSKGIDALRGEKAFGMLAFFNFAEGCNVFTKPLGEAEHCSLRMSKFEKHATCDYLDARNVPYGPIKSHGTRIILSGIDPVLIERYFTPAKLKEALSEIFSPILRRGEVNITVGYHGRGKKLVRVEPVRYKGELILEKQIEVPYKKDNEDKVGLIDVQLYVNPKGTSEKVVTYNKGIRVLTSLASLEELRHHPWDSRKVSGKIDENFLTLTPSREGYLRGKRFRMFTRDVISLEKKVSSELSRLREVSKKHEMQDFANQWLRVLDPAYAQIRQNNEVLTLGRTGDKEKPVVVKDKDTVKSRLGGKRKKKPKKDGRPELEEILGGEIRPVRRGRKIVSAVYQVSFEPFDMSEQNISSRLDTIGNVIRINTLHPVYKKLDENGSQKAKQRHIGLLISKEVAFAEFKRAVEKLNLPPVEQGHMMTEIIAQFYHSGIESLKLN